MKNKDILEKFDEVELLEMEKNYPFSAFINVLINRQHLLNEGNLSLIKMNDLINKVNSPGLALFSVIDKGEKKIKKKLKAKNKTSKNKKNNKISKQKKEESQSDVTDLHFGIASEELAKIYIKQGLKKQAIEMYRKLSLQNPEKSVYFAKILEKLNKK